MTAPPPPSVAPPSGPGPLARTALLALIAWSVALPLRDVLRYPDRLSVLPNLQTDAAAYDAIGRALADSWRLDALPPRHPPGWVTVLAVVYGIAGPSYVAGKLVSWAALLGLVAGCAWLARRLYGPPAGWAAALLCASSPALRGYVGTLQYEVLTAALLLLTVGLAVRASESPMESELPRAALAGVAGSLLVLTREPFAVAVLLVAAWLATRLAPRRGPRRALAVAMIVTAVAAAPAIAWTVVQSVRHRTLITLSEKGPIVIELGNNPLANGTYNAPLVGVAPPTGLDFVRAHPRRWLELAGRKILYFWGVLRDGWNVPRPAAVWAWRASTGLVPLDALAALARGGWLAIGFVVALWWLGRDGRRQWWVLPAIVVALMAVHVATLSSHRFAVPVLPLVFTLISGPLAAAAAAAGRALRSRAAFAAFAIVAAIVIAMQFQQWPLRLHMPASALDGLSADNVVDPVSGARVRYADARRGPRPIALLADEYLPAGRFVLDVDLRRTDDQTGLGVPAARITVVDLDDRPACERTVTADELAMDAWHAVRTTCELIHDGPATLAIHSLGSTGLAVGDVALTWIR